MPMIASFIKYLIAEKRFSLHTTKSYQKDLEQLEDFVSSNYSLDNLLKISHSHIRDWVMSLSESGLSIATINRKIASTKSFYKFLVKKDYLDQNPASRIKPLRSGKKLPLYLKENEMINLLDVIDFPENFEGNRDRLILEVLYNSGIRLSELIELRESDINFSDGTIKVLGKRNKERLLPVSISTLKMIRSFLREKGDLEFTNIHLFVTNQGHKLYPMFVYRKVNHYLKLVSTISKKSPHVIRHTFATHLLNKGADLNAVKDLLGHASLAATQVYTHNSIEKLKSAYIQAHPKA